MDFASRVHANTDLWHLNSWYKGQRRSFSSSLLRPDGSWTASAQEKAELLNDTWSPPPAKLQDTFLFYDHEVLNTRPFVPVSSDEITSALRGTSNTSAPGMSGLNYVEV